MCVVAHDGNAPLKLTSHSQLPYSWTLHPVYLSHAHRKNLELIINHSNLLLDQSFGLCSFPSRWWSRTTSAKRVHFHTLHRKASFFRWTPRWPPDAARIPEFQLRRETLVTPWLVPNLVTGVGVSRFRDVLTRHDENDLREIAIGASHCNIENEIEFLVERRVCHPSLTPWIVQGAVVDNVLSKLSSAPHVGVTLRELEIHNLLLIRQSSSEMRLQLKWHATHQKPTINIRKEEFVAPFHPVCVKAVAVICPSDCMLAVC